MRLPKLTTPLDRCMVYPAPSLCIPNVAQGTLARLVVADYRYGIDISAKPFEVFVPISRDKPGATPRRERPDRENKKLLAAHVDVETFDSFRALVRAQSSTTDAMVTKALALLFENFGHRPPPPLRRKLKHLGL